MLRWPAILDSVKLLIPQKIIRTIGGNVPPVCQHIARKEGVSVAELTRQALTKFIADRQEKKYISFLGIGNSGKSNIADRSEDLLWDHVSVKPKAKG